MRRLLEMVTGLAIFTALCSSPAFGQSPTVLNDLEQLTGEWSGETTMHSPQGDVDAGSGTLVAVAGPGSSLIIDYKGTSGRFSDFRIHQVISWDRETGELSMAWVDSFNPGLSLQTGRVSESELIFTPTKQPSGPQRESAIMNISAESFTIQSRAGSDAGVMQPVMTLRFKRATE